MVRFEKDIPSTTTRMPASVTLKEQAAVKRRTRPSIFWAVAPLILLDAFCVTLSLIVAYVLRFRLIPYHAPFSAIFYQRLLYVGVPMWALIFAVHRLYHPDHLFGGLQEYAGVVNASTLGLVALILYSFLDRRTEHDISRGWLMMLWLFSVLTVTGVRFGYRRLIYRLREQGLFVRRAVVVGTNEEGKVVADQLRSTPRAGIEVIGFIDPTLRLGSQVDGLTVLGRPEGLGSVVERYGVEEIVVIPTALEREMLLDLYRDWGTDRRVRIRLSSGLYELFTTGVQVQEVGFIPLVSLNRTRITGVDAVLKTLLDYGGALVGTILLLPLLLLIAFLVRLDSPGQIVYRRRVVGLGGKEFDAFKFRTMIADADAYLEAHPELKREWEETGKIRNDPRITRLGRLLRRYSLDELPQLLNVLRGEMSLVGPRMITPAELHHFGRWRHNLLTVKPGMTGLWQISGRADLAYEERVRLDMYYIRNYTIWLDLKLLVNTFLVVVRGRGAY